MDSNGGASGGERALSRPYEVDGGGGDAKGVGDVWRREVVHLVIQDNPGVSHYLRPKIGVDGAALTTKKQINKQTTTNKNNKQQMG